MSDKGSAAEAPVERLSTWDSLKVYGERRVFVMLLLGFSAGMPNLLIFDTLSAWLREAGMTLEVIGFFALATLTYALKFVWAPLVDRTTIPFLTKWLGHRRSWMLVTQAVVILGLWLIAGSNPVSMLGAMAAFAVLVGFFGATQDIVIDAWRIEAAEARRSITNCSTPRRSAVATTPLRCRWARSSWAMCSWCGPGTASRPTAGWWRAAPRSTSRPSPAKRFLSRSESATTCWRAA